jgi:hypothetical protein
VDRLWPTVTAVLGVDHRPDLRVEGPADMANRPWDDRLTRQMHRVRAEPLPPRAAAAAPDFAHQS